MCIVYRYLSLPGRSFAIIWPSYLFIHFFQLVFFSPFIFSFLIYLSFIIIFFFSR